MKKLTRIIVVVLLLGTTVLLLAGCTREPEGEVPPEEEVEEPVITESSRWFPDSVRWLTAEEKDRLIEIALNTPAALEWQQKESQYKTSIGWIALYPNLSGEGYSGYSKYEYEIVETGILTYPSGKTVSNPKDADIYPNVTIWFGQPDKWVVSVAVDLKAERTVYSEDYPAR